MLALNIYTKLGKALSQSDQKDKFRSSFEKGAIDLISAIEHECTKDKSMSNLKGKIKEIQNMVKNM